MAFARHRMGSRRRRRAGLNGPLGLLRQRRSRAIVLRLGAVVLALTLVFGYAATAYAQALFDDLPAVSGLDPSTWNGTTRIFDRNGTLLAAVGAEGDQRTAVHLSDVSPKLIEATVAVEDRSFWTNPGYDLQGIARAGLGS